MQSCLKLASRDLGGSLEAGVSNAYCLRTAVLNLVRTDRGMELPFQPKAGDRRASWTRDVENQGHVVCWVSINDNKKFNKEMCIGISN